MKLTLPTRAAPCLRVDGRGKKEKAKTEPRLSKIDNAMREKAIYKGDEMG
jgi:hypothetical protein